MNYAQTGTISDEERAQAHVKTAAEARKALQRIGYPAMIKASEGGGGKGIRKVTKEEDVEAAFRQVRTSSSSSTLMCGLAFSPRIPFVCKICSTSKRWLTAGGIGNPRRVGVCDEARTQRSSP